MSLPVSLVATAVAALALLIGALIWTRMLAARRRERIHDALKTYDATVVVDERTGEAACRLRGFAVLFRFASRGSGSSSEAWTEAIVEVGHGPLVMHVRPQKRRDERLAEKGLAVDVELGNPLFDDAFFVEAAPAEVVRLMFSAEVQRRLVALAPDEIETVPLGLRLAKRGWNEQAEAIAEFADLAATLAAGIEPAMSQARDAAVLAPMNAYRGADREKREQARRAVDERQAAEVAHVKRLHENRASLDRMMQVIVVAVVAVIAIAAWLFVD